MEQLATPHRMSHGNIHHSLEAIVVIGLCTVMCGGEGFEAIELIDNARKSYEECTTQMNPVGVSDLSS